MAKVSSNKARTLAAAILVVALSVFVQLLQTPTVLSEDVVTVWIFDVGQGDAIFIDAPDAQVLVDGGPNGVVLEKLSAVMPFWDRSIDLVVNTHPHADHVTGLNYVLERFDVGNVWVGGQEYGTDTFTHFEKIAEEEVVSSGTVLDLGSGASLEVIWPLVSLEDEQLQDPNGGSVVLLLTHGEATVLLTGDIGTKEEIHLLPKLGHIDVLKVGHQGSKTSTAAAFVDHIDPDYSVISVGKNSYGHPHQIVLDRLEAVGSWILRTDKDGDIRIQFDGGEPRVARFDL